MDLAGRHTWRYAIGRPNNCHAPPQDSYDLPLPVTTVALMLQIIYPWESYFPHYEHLGLKECMKCIWKPKLQNSFEKHPITSDVNQVSAV